MSRTRCLFLLVGIFLVLGATQAQAQSGLLNGTVVDADGNPIEGAKVTITSESLPSFHKVLNSNKKGKFRLRFQSTQLQYQFEFLFEKPGYQSFKQPFSPTSTRQMNEEFMMEQGESQAQESLGDLGSVVSGADNAAIMAFNAGLEAQRSGDLDTAQAKLGEAIAADDSLGPAHVALAQVLLDQKQYEAAVASADKALSLATSRPESLRVKYQALRALGKTEEAEAISLELQSAEDNAASAKRIYNEGGEAFRADDHATALVKFRQAAELDPSLTDAHHAVATLELAAGNAQAAADSARKALDLGSNDVNTLRVLYDALDALGNTEELMEIAPRLATVDPEFGGGKLLEQAGALWNNGDTKKAVALSRQALAIDSSLAKAYYFIGLDHLSRGENAEAKASLQKFVDMAPEDSEAGTAKEMMSYIE